MNPSSTHSTNVAHADGTGPPNAYRLRNSFLPTTPYRLTAFEILSPNHPGYRSRSPTPSVPGESGTWPQHYGTRAQNLICATSKGGATPTRSSQHTLNTFLYYYPSSSSIPWSFHNLPANASRPHSCSKGLDTHQDCSQRIIFQFEITMMTRMSPGPTPKSTAHPLRTRWWTVVPPSSRTSTPLAKHIEDQISRTPCASFHPQQCLRALPTCLFPDASLKHSDERVALQAVEFWTTVSAHQTPAPSTFPIGTHLCLTSHSFPPLLTLSPSQGNGLFDESIKDLPHELQDRVNALPQSYRDSPQAAALFEAMMDEAMDATASSPPLKIAMHTSGPSLLVRLLESWCGSLPWYFFVSTEPLPSSVGAQTMIHLQSSVVQDAGQSVCSLKATVVHAKPNRNCTSIPAHYLQKIPTHAAEYDEPPELESSGDGDLPDDRPSDREAWLEPRALTGRKSPDRLNN
ncbi:hypothetical protein DEU56DRAFT_946437 [Suillus clintonianus]|uniref:uncharacterized protein n=1 Tax=Suillus clintonianus TaxID=1904413 RepID=UPI001B885A4C|nr:uncharacterized protein DEU56DRAFT_946437 [Suillus clintonianus]KAG2137048.1 hypothetical protein DEU56DRAFT_946437 [Suillus clintonianus]